MTNPLERNAAEERFRPVFAHLGAVTAYARRRGHRDPDAVAAEVMTIAWRRLADVPRDDPRPWLFKTARNLLLADARRALPATGAVAAEGAAPAPDLIELDSALGDALRALSPADREALLLVAWEDLTPAQAARSLGINATAFRVRLLRARRRLQQKLADEHVARCEPSPNLDVETT
jgi:RNA polymerase sigma-70 factor (ECF subfamily)